MTAKAAEAFALYVGMGPGRSLTGLAYMLVERNQYKTRTTARASVAVWSAKYRWQERLAAAITAKIEDALAKATEIDAGTFLKTSELLAKQLAGSDTHTADLVIKVRETVRKPEPRGAQASVNVNLSVTLRAIVERVAAEQGLNPDEVLAEADRIIAGGG